jgi:hypothetical protein
MLAIGEKNVDQMVRLATMTRRNEDKFVSRNIYNTVDTMTFMTKVLKDFNETETGVRALRIVEEAPKVFYIYAYFFRCIFNVFLFVLRNVLLSVSLCHLLYSSLFRRL